MKGSEFIFDYIHLFYYKCHKINPNFGGSYIDSLDWMTNKKAAMNPINKKDNKCFKHTLNHEEVKKDLQKITKIKPFMNKYNWGEINLPLNVLYAKKEKSILVMFQNMTQIVKNML